MAVGGWHFLSGRGWNQRRSNRFQSILGALVADPRCPCAHRMVPNPIGLPWLVPPRRGRSMRMGCGALHRANVIHQGVTMPKLQMALLHRYCCTGKGVEFAGANSKLSRPFSAHEQGGMLAFSPGAEKECSAERCGNAVFKWHSNGQHPSGWVDPTEHTKCARCQRADESRSKNLRVEDGQGQITAALTPNGSFLRD